MFDNDNLLYEKRNSKTTRYRNPIIRIQKKNSIKKQASVNNIDCNALVRTIDFSNNYFHPKKNILHKKVGIKINDLINKNPLNKSKSVTNYKDYCLKSKPFLKKKLPIRRNINNNYIKKYNNTIEIPMNINKNHRNKSLPEQCTTIKNNIRLKIKNDYYCINCYNRKYLQKNKPKISFKNLNKSFDQNYYYKTIELKQLDESYINNKVLKNQERQLIAFNLLKKEKDKNPISIKEKLQYINENEDNPFIGFNLQDYLYYKNKNNNEILNKTIIKNINSYKLENPRKAVKDYYKNVQFQIPILEKKFGPSGNYKTKYIEALKKQMSDKEKEKKEIKNLKIKTEAEENKKYKEFLIKLEKDEKEHKKLKQKIMFENNKYLEEFKKKRDEIKKKKKREGRDGKFKIFNENQKDYKYFVNQQRINEINSLQKWINENMKQKQKQIEKENNHLKRWVDYNKEFNKTFDENTYAIKCSDCNSINLINRLYEL